MVLSFATGPDDDVTLVHVRLHIQYVPVHHELSSFLIYQVLYVLGRRPHCRVGTSDFDAQMSGIKIKKGNEILRPVYKKPFSEILSDCIHFVLFSS
jgi:hypothetical protein